MVEFENLCMVIFGVFEKLMVYFVEFWCKGIVLVKIVLVIKEGFEGGSLFIDIYCNLYKWVGMVMNVFKLKIVVLNWLVEEFVVELV